jgi:hypothetical protein
VKAECVTDALKKNKKYDIVMSPGLGLFLNMLYFDGYNKKQAGLIKQDQKNNRKNQGQKRPNEGSSSSEIDAKKARTETSDATDSTSAEAPAAEGDKIDTQKEQAKGKGEVDESVHEVPAAEGDKMETQKEQAKGKGEVDESVHEVPAAEGDKKETQKEQAKGKGEVDESVHEVIEWSGVGSVKGFVDDSIVKHIFEQEATSLQFMYFLDYLRAYPAKWSETSRLKNEQVESTKKSDLAEVAAVKNEQPEKNVVPVVVPEASSS